MKLLQFLKECRLFTGKSQKMEFDYFLAKRHVVWPFVAVFISGCIQIYPMYASIVDNQVVFTFDRWAGDDVTYRLNGIEVRRIDCSSNCTMWQLSPDPDIWERRPIEVPEIGNYIVYGISLGDFISIRGPVPLASGNYSVSARILIEDPLRPRARLVMGEFSLERDSQGNITVIDGEDRSTSPDINRSIRQ